MTTALRAAEGPPAGQGAQHGEEAPSNTTSRQVAVRVEPEMLAEDSGARVLKSVTEGVNAGAAKAKIDVEKPLADALAGMDDALLKVVNANQMALERLLDHGADFEDSKIRKALGDLDRLEDEFLKIVKQSAEAASKPVNAQWGGVFANRQGPPRHSLPRKCAPPSASSVMGRRKRPTSW